MFISPELEDSVSKESLFTEPRGEEPLFLQFYRTYYLVDLGFPMRVLIRDNEKFFAGIPCCVRIISTFLRFCFTKLLMSLGCVVMVAIHEWNLIIGK